MNPFTRIDLNVSTNSTIGMKNSSDIDHSIFNERFFRNFFQINKKVSQQKFFKKFYSIDALKIATHH